MSDVINSIFGRAQNETPSSEGYGYGSAATETVDTDATETVEPAEDTTETEDAVEETTDVADTDEADSADDTEEDTADEESDEAVADVAEESDEDTADTDTDTAADEAVAEEAEAAEEVPVAVETTETEAAEAADEAGSRPAAGSRGSTTVADGVVSKIVIRVARKAEGVYELDEAGTSVEVDGEVATIAVTLVVEFGRAVKTLAEQIRIQVVEAVEQYLGLEVASVDVHVADIHFPDAD